MKSSEACRASVGVDDVETSLEGSCGRGRRRFIIVVISGRGAVLLVSIFGLLVAPSAAGSAAPSLSGKIGMIKVPRIEGEGRESLAACGTPHSCSSFD